MNSLNWKSSEIYKTSGSVVKPGTFIGMDGKPTSITPEIVRKAYENIDDHVPFYLTHEGMGSPMRKNIGYGFKFALDDITNNVAHNGFVFDQGAKQKIVMEGFDHVSPELEFTYENESVVDVKLVGMAFVKNPAIEGNNVDVAITAFSKPEPVDMKNVDSFLKGKGLTENEIQTIRKAFSTTAEPPAPPVADATAGTSTPATPPVVDAPKVVTPDVPFVEPPVVSAAPAAPASTITSEEVAELKSLVASLKADNDKMLEGQYNTVVSELKGLGIANPGTIVAGLDPKQKIATLTKIKENIAKTGSLTQTPQNLGSSGASSPANDEAFIRDQLKDIGVSYEDYLEIMK